MISHPIKSKLGFVFLVKMILVCHFLCKNIEGKSENETHLQRVIMDVTVNAWRDFSSVQKKRHNFMCCGSFKSDHKKTFSASHQVRRLDMKKQGHFSEPNN